MILAPIALVVGAVAAGSGGPLLEGAIWGAAPHRAIATVAAELLTPETLDQVRALLGDSSLASVSAWADEIRRTLVETAPWHFINIPIDGNGKYDRTTHCAGGDCVIEAIRFHQKLLSDRKTPRGARLEALKYLVHFVGDLHQPLHVGDNRDRGGNDVTVSLPGQGQQRLHAVWDFGLFESTGWTEDRLTIEAGIQARANQRQWRRGSVLDWAFDSWAIARSHAYRFPDGGRLDPEYVSGAVAVSVTQLAKAAVRLAEILNRSLGS